MKVLVGQLARDPSSSLCRELLDSAEQHSLRDHAGKVTDNTPVGTKQFGDASMTIEETNEWLGW